jgi:hypothetical protein
MNSLEFRAVLDWWMCSDPWPESVPKGIVDTWLQGECHLRGYHSIIHAYHRHESEVSAAPASPALPPEQASGPVLEAGSVARGSATLGHEQPLAAGNEPSAQPLSTSALSRLGQAMLADYVAHEVYSVEHVLNFLNERGTWLDREMRNGGNQEYLRLKYEECRYIAQCIRDTRDRLAKEPK